MPCINFINDNFTKTQLKDKQIPELKIEFKSKCI